MSLSSGIKDREYNKFDEVNGKTVVRTHTTIEGEAVWDEIVTTFPSSTTDLFTYKKNSSVVQTVLVTYQDVSKKVIINITKTSF